MRAQRGAVVVLVAALSACDGRPTTPPALTPAQVNTLQANSRCLDRVALIEAAASAAWVGRNLDASQLLQPCAFQRDDADLKGLAKQFEAAHWLSIARNPKALLSARAEAYARIEKDFPTTHAAIHDEARPVVAQYTKERVAREKVAEARERAERRQRGVQIGMTQEEVLQSSWGKPRKINRTTYSFGVHEQWVYDGGYLYFKNGILDAIQN